MGSLRGYAHIKTYKFLTPNGHYFFGKERWELLDPISGKRSKEFRYWDPRANLQRKPYGADAYLYRLPEVLSAIRTGNGVIHWAEGEKDADRLAKAGVVATSHHQGAGRVTLEQAEWLRGAQRVVLWYDLDPARPEVGAYDVVLRHDLLIQVGVPAGRIQIVCSRSGKDAFDHLEAGFTVNQARRADRLKLVATARNYRPAASKKLGYRDA